ncbi:MAG: hypothetical protein LBI40_01565 [Treponema sp.]|jgi:hypothetical protein|nr:hypothetical protein [Treponema sp.]
MIDSSYYRLIVLSSIFFVFMPFFLLFSGYQAASQADLSPPLPMKLRDLSRNPPQCRKHARG